uniref:Cystatin domain-containing protein n=1 Tax=Steinernema glaseri TaxID=37863 RepID=A0A1I7ZHY7_9BILA
MLLVAFLCIAYGHGAPATQYPRSTSVVDLKDPIVEDLKWLAIAKINAVKEAAVGEVYAWNLFVVKEVQWVMETVSRDGEPVYEIKMSIAQANCAREDLKWLAIAKINAVKEAAVGEVYAWNLYTVKEVQWVMETVSRDGEPVYEIKMSIAQANCARENVSAYDLWVNPSICATHRVNAEIGWRVQIIKSRMVNIESWEEALNSCRIVN